MTCREFDRTLCDYLDGTANLDDRRAVEDHAGACPACSQTFADAEFALGVIREVPQVEPPPELVGNIIRETIAAGALAPAAAGGGSGPAGFLSPLWQPFLQPRFAMGLAMTLLWLSLVSFHGRDALASIEPDQATPSAIAGGVAEGLDRVWQTGFELYETAVIFYRLETEFGEGELHISEPDAPPSASVPPPAGSGETEGEQ